MSMRLLGDPRAVHEVCDDVESIIWLLLWVIAKFGPHEMMPGDTHSFLEVFDPNPANPHDRKRAFAHYGRLRIKHLALRTPALESLLNELVDVLPKDIDTPSELLRDHTWLINRLKSASENKAWMATKDDGSRMHDITEPASSARRKRKASISTYWSELEDDRVAIEEERRERLKYSDYLQVEEVEVAIGDENKGFDRDLAEDDR